MQKVSELYRTIFENSLHEKEVRINIAGVDYTQKNIISATTYGGMYNPFGIGNAAARQITLEILPLGEIPRQAEIKAFVRLVLGEQKSEWLQKGVFFITKRNMDKRTGVLKIEGFDAMLKSESVWLTPDYDLESWPMPQVDAVKDIAYRMGVEVDERTVLSTEFPVAYPIDENGDLTMREVLSYIAVSNAGNWIITDEGKLLLIGTGDLPPETNYLITEYGSAITFGGVRILV